MIWLPRTTDNSTYFAQSLEIRGIESRLYLVKNLRLQGSHRLEKYLNLEGFLEKSMKIKYALKSSGKSCKGLEKSLNSSTFCRI